MAGWWETQLQGAPGWLALRGDVIAGCTRLIDWPCCSVARDDGHEARSCTAATVSCSPLLRLFPWLFLCYFSLLSLCFSSMLPLSIYLSSLFSGSFVYSLSLPLSLCPSLSLWLAGFSRLVVVCWGCCTTLCMRMLLSVFWRREKPWISGLSPAKHKPGMTPTYIYTRTVYTQQRCSFAARSENEFNWESLLKNERREAVLLLPPPLSDVGKQIRNESVCVTQWNAIFHNWRHLPLLRGIVPQFGKKKS